MGRGRSKSNRGCGTVTSRRIPAPVLPSSSCAGGPVRRETSTSIDHVLTHSQLDIAGPRGCLDDCCGVGRRVRRERRHRTGTAGACDHRSGSVGRGRCRGAGFDHHLGERGDLCGDPERDLLLFGEHRIRPRELRPTGGSPERSIDLPVGGELRDPTRRRKRPRHPGFRPRRQQFGWRRGRHPPVRLHGPLDSGT